MKQNFYRAFEDRYRGSRELIRGRLESYAPFVRPLLPPEAADAARPRALDLGCGRGEWMQLLRDWGFDTRGVDMDAGMLQACREAGLDVVEGDALAYLRALPDASQAVVSAFHVVEHIPFADLETLVAESLRVLAPAGLLILETPNPENLIVGTERFYLDPTHTQPIPHQLLSFMLEYQGFARVKVLPLQEPTGIRDKPDVGMFDVIAGTSPDYAAVGQKLADAPVLQPFDGVFAAAYGQDLLGLTRRFDDSQARSFARQEAGTAELRAEFSQFERQIAQTLNASTERLEQLVGEVQNLRQTVHAVYNSSSWRVTAPLRALSRFYRRLRGGAGRWVRNNVAVPADMARPAANDIKSTKVPMGPTAREAYRLLEAEKASRQEKP